MFYALLTDEETRGGSRLEERIKNGDAREAYDSRIRVSGISLGGGTSRGFPRVVTQGETTERGTRRRNIKRDR